MDAHFWHQKWEKNEIGFHRNEANPFLVKHLPALNLATGSRVFVPLCGKTLDIGWLLAQGFCVAGAELSQIAVNQLFDALGVVPTVKVIGKMQHYQAQHLDIFVGDIFDLDADVLGEIDTVYDRAALVALPADMRCRYAAHLAQITQHAPQLLICFNYDQNQLNGPPFSIPDEEVHKYYATGYTLTLLESCALEGGLKGQCPAVEKVWMLKSKVQ